MSTVLIVSQRPSAAEMLALLSHTSILAADSETALAHIDGADVVLVDGREDLAWARAITSTLHSAREEAPILLLVPMNGLALIGRDWGFSDFLLVDSEPSELDARIRLLLKSADASKVLVAGPIRIDEAAYHATLSGEPLDLTYTEFELLRYLMQHPGRVLTREVLLSQVWGYDYFGGTRTVDVHVRRLRAKLGQYDSYIGTVRNVGYRFTSVREGRNDQDRVVQGPTA
ncbi:response regulator transcription factor [Tessaracoccus rhinocerotis]|uniref:Response regulator transcription factor n=1 Tax=Tessaracoccus rhinocerotis TaxID=1689449 RepID=A0A553K1M9_9ACTN|nr:response regulator transcription factor [Tessaracoccus rhinocerotis]TRY18603.1 response regulator transcription factor [Tessaracoccus rhinocerotis]